MGDELVETLIEFNKESPHHSEDDKALDDDLFETSEGEDNVDAHEPPGIDHGHGGYSDEHPPGSNFATGGSQKPSKTDSGTTKKPVSVHEVHRAMGEVSYSMFSSFMSRRLRTIRSNSEITSQPSSRKASKPRPVMRRKKDGEYSSDEKVIKYEKIMKELAVSLLGEEHKNDKIVQIAAGVAAAAVGPKGPQPGDAKQSTPCVVPASKVTSDQDHSSSLSCTKSFQIKPGSCPRNQDTITAPEQKDSQDGSADTIDSLRDCQLGDGDHATPSLNSLSHSNYEEAELESDRTLNYSVYCNAATSMHSSSLDASLGSQREMNAFVDPVWAQAVLPESRKQFYQSLISPNEADSTAPEVEGKSNLPESQLRGQH